MCSSPTDPNCSAPGDNDDASGKAAVVEMACAMSNHKFEVIIIFIAKPGEEQGLLGAAYFARQALEKKLFTKDIIRYYLVYKSS